MLAFLQKHPFAVETFFEHSLVLTYAIPKEQLLPLIPECLTLDTFENDWGFIALAMVKTSNLRPKGFPAFLGDDFFLTGYRIFTRYTTSKGKRLRGLYIIKSETNKPKMTFFGNIFTHYKYTTTDISCNLNTTGMEIISEKSDLRVLVNDSKEEVALPAYSPFTDWKEARRFAGPLPYTFTYNAETKEVLIIEGVRENWTPRPVEVLEQHSGFIKQLGFSACLLANAFIIENIPYYWKKGKMDLWQG